MDTELPSDPDQTIAEDGSTQPSCKSFWCTVEALGFHDNYASSLVPAWKARFGKEIISAIVEGTTRSSAPKYSVILDLDRKIRDMELPKYARDPTPVGTGLGQTMSHFMPINYRELCEYELAF